MLEYVTFGLLVAKIILDFVAPRTKTKVDDKFRDAVGKVKDLVPVVAGAKTADSKPVEGFKTDTSRDHRK